MVASAMSNVSVRPVRTEADHAAALRDIDTLMDARPGTSDGDRLDVLVTLVQAYEARYHPVPPRIRWMRFAFAWSRRDWRHAILSPTSAAGRASRRC